MPTSRRQLALCLVLTVACAVPDPNQLGGYPDACVTTDNCAPGFDCQERHCVLLPGSACQEGVKTQACEQTLGVCAGTQHACVDGKYEMTCTGASYGPQYEERETRCDGQDNDCDGHTDAGEVQLSAAGKLLAFPRGYAFFSWSQRDGQDVVAYQLLNQRFEPAGPLLILETSSVLSNDVQAVPYSDGALILWYGGDTSSGPQHARIARLVHGAAWGEVAIEAGPLTLEGQSAGAFRMALDGEGGHLLVAWLEARGVRGQLLSPNLLPLSQGSLLDASELDGAPDAQLTLPDVAPAGALDFAVAALHTDTEGKRTVLFRTVSSSLAPLSGLATYPAAAEGLLDVNVTGAPGHAPVLLWLNTVGRQSGWHVTVDVVRPLSAAPPTRLIESPNMQLFRLSTALSPAGELAVAHTTEVPQATSQLTLHLMSAEGRVREQRYDFAPAGFFHLTWVPNPERWLISDRFNRPQGFWTCTWQ